MSLWLNKIGIVEVSSSQPNLETMINQDKQKELLG